jgi:CheY-like chemotaxis protein
VVDDDEPTRERFGHWLGERYDVATAGDGFAAMTRILERRPDLIVLDLEMPRVSGYELLGALHGISQSIPILALSAGHTHRAGDRMGPLVLGAADVVAKPVDHFDLVHKTDMLLRLEGPPPCLMDPEEARALFDWTAQTRVLPDDRFRARLDRACDFGVRFGIPSSLLAVAAPSADVLDRMVNAADATLRFEDAVLVVSKRRMLALLVASEQDNCGTVLDRIASNAAGDEPAPRVQWQASAALPATELRDWRVLFRDLEDHAEEEAS